MSLFSRLRSVVSGDDYLDGDYDDELEYDGGEPAETPAPGRRSSALAPATDFRFDDPFVGSNVIGMPGISSQMPEINLMEPRSFDEMPKAIQALRERKTVILNLTMMEPDQAQRAVDFVAGGTFAIDGHQERIGESIFLFAPSCVSVTTALSEDGAGSASAQREPAQAEPEIAPSPAWGRQDTTF